MSRSRPGRGAARWFRGTVAPGETRLPLPTPSFALRVNLSLFPAFPGRRTTRSEGTAGVGLGRGEGEGLRGGGSAPEVHGRRGCPPPRLAPGPERREGELAGGGRRGHGGGGRSSLGSGRTEPDSGRQRRRRGVRSSLPSDPASRSQTDRPRRPRPPTHPGPPGQLPLSLSPSLSPESSFPWCSPRKKKNFF